MTPGGVEPELPPPADLIEADRRERADQREARREREEKRFATKGRPTVQLTTFDGAIVIRGWDRNEVSVEIDLEDEDLGEQPQIDELPARFDEVARPEIAHLERALFTEDAEYFTEPFAEPWRGQMTRQVSSSHSPSHSGPSS